MRPRYLARWQPDGAVPITIGDIGLPIIVDRPGLTIAADPSVPLLALDDGGLVLGRLFGRGQQAAPDAVDAEDRDAIARSRGESLIARYWGAYLALLPRPRRRLDLVRGPLGHLACYTHWARGCWWIASDAALIGTACGTRPPLATEALARHLGYPEQVEQETCLTGIVDVRGGDRVELGDAGRRTTSTLWSPWTFAGRARQHIGRAEASDRVREATTRAIEAHAGCHKRILLMLSGGLDSSIVASCLAKSATAVTALTFVTADRIGDERDFARETAGYLGIPLAEALRDPAGVDFERSLAADLPRPMARAFNQESHRLTANEADRTGATAIFDGGGGDNLFCSHRSVAAVADGLLASGFDGAFMETARALGDLTQAGLPRVLTAAIKRAWFRPVGLRRVRDTSFLSPRAAGFAMARADHPWFCAPRGALPGRAVHVALLATAQAMIESGGIAGPIERLSPIVTQPVAEACLAIPSHCWFAQGHDRAAARQAFADRLPARIIDRRSKGSPAPFAAMILEARREALKPFLLDGVLAGHGVIDTDAVRRFLDDPAPRRGFAFTRVLTLIDAEAWARNWA